jgi:predicted lipoprotein
MTLAGLMSAAIISCGSDKNSEPASTGLVDKPLIENLVDEVILVTYNSLAERATALMAAAEAFRTDRDDNRLQALRTAWSDTRSPWEQSEGFLFGPVDANGYDPAMDTWPLNRTDLDFVLKSNDVIDAEFVRNLADNQKGFHAIEYLIFGTDTIKAPGAFTDREINYMTAGAKNLEEVATHLVESWSNKSEGNESFRTTFTTAGESGNTVYPSTLAAGQEILNGLIGICEEVADSKIAAPLDAQDPNLVESQFSLNSLEDFSDNIRSVQNVWRGTTDSSSEASKLSLSARIGTVNSALNLKVDGQIEAAIDAILAIPSPFPESLLKTENKEIIQKAQQKIRDLQATLLDEVKPLLEK